VRYTLQAARDRFDVSFLTYDAANLVDATQRELAELVDQAIVLPSIYGSSRPLAKRFVSATAHGKAWLNCLKPSNCLIGDMEFSPARVMPIVTAGNYDLVLFEYWHAWRAAEACGRSGCRTVLDTHNVLWHTYQQYLDRVHLYPWPLRSVAVARYRRHEERAWDKFGGLIAINRSELAHIQRVVAPQTRVIYAPMGIDMGLWPYSYRPARPCRIAYYGGLGSARNAEAAQACHRTVMPHVWNRWPDAEYWVIGSSPPAALQDLQSDPRVRVTGFVDEPAKLLGSMSVVLCPWQGTYGFRSRVVEVLAAGAPMVAFRDAVDGMDFEDGDGITLVDDLASMAERVASILADPSAAAAQSRAGRRQASTIYDAATTYGAMVGQLAEWVSDTKGVTT
jgi:glycosyltransferase involved in cell wall biosynthesis